MSMGILMILISVLTTVFGQILDVQLESKSISSVDQNGRYIMARLMYDMQQAESIASPSAAGEQSDTLKIKINSIDYIYTVSNSGNLIVINNYGTDVLNSNSATISGLRFTRLGSGGNDDTVRIDFSVISKTQRVPGVEQKNFQTTLGLQ